MTEAKTVAILGAGPVGLAAAAHVLERGLEPVVLEAGPDAGHAVGQWSHVRMFSPWEYNIDKAAERLLATVGWNAPSGCDYPTGGELVAQRIRRLYRAIRVCIKLSVMPDLHLPTGQVAIQVRHDRRERIPGFYDRQIGN